MDYKATLPDAHVIPEMLEYSPEAQPVQNEEFTAPVDGLIGLWILRHDET
jgi:hypothetical protein